MTRFGLASAFAAIALLASSAAGAAECEADIDCGHGFYCFRTSGSGASTGGVTSGGGSVCGDGMCQVGVEDFQSCPVDCEEVTLCLPDECEEDGDCAEGYECNPSPRPGTGGTSGPFCGDGICNSTENTENCAEDCDIPDVCQVKLIHCVEDNECPEGFSCVYPSSGSGSSGAGVGGATGASSGSTGVGGSPAPATGGVCSPDGGLGEGGGAGTSAVGSIGFTGVGGAAQSGAGGSSEASGVTGVGGESTGSGNGGSGAADNGTGTGGTVPSGTGSGGLDATSGSGAVGATDGDPGSGTSKGCSVAGGRAPGGAGSLLLLVGLTVARLRRRRS